jgi:hypothetical protein
MPGDFHRSFDGSLQQSGRSMTQVEFDGTAHATELSVAWRQRFIIARVRAARTVPAVSMRPPSSHVMIFPA